MLALVANWKHGAINSNDLADVLDVIRIYIIRRRIIGLTQSENKVFPSMVNKIQEIINADNKRAMMFRIVANNENGARLPNDLEIARYLESANFYSSNYCKYILALIEEQITGSRPDMQDIKLQIEHIMPQKLTAEWRMSLGKNAEEIHQGLVHTIGNLTLIRQNQELGQKPFWEKRKFEGRKWRLTSLTREIQARRGERVTSKHYQGSEYWEYDGTRLTDIVND